MKRIFLLLILNLLIAGYGRAQKSRLQRQGNATQLIINDTPYLILGGELGNSSAASTQDIERIFPKLQKMGLNTVSPCILGFAGTRRRTFRFHIDR